MNNVMERVKQAGSDSQYLEPLQLAVIRFVSTLPGIYATDGAHLDTFVSSLVNCIVTATNIQLRQSSASFLHGVLVKAGASTLSPPEYNAWILALEQYPSAAAVFKESCMLLLSRQSDFNEKMESVFDIGAPSQSEIEKMTDIERNQTQVYSPLLLAVWERLSQETDLSADLKTFCLSASCGLLHCQLADAKTFASALSKHTPPKLMDKAFKSYLKLWASDSSKSKAIDCASLGLGKLSTLLFDCTFRIEDDWPTLKGEWDTQLIANEDRPDKLEAALQQVTSYLSLSLVRSGDQPLQLLDLMQSIIDQEKEHSDDSLAGKFLRHPSTVSWFDPMELNDPFTVRFTCLVHGTLQKLKSSVISLYKEKLLDAMRQTVAIPVKKGRKKAKLLKKDMLLSLIDLFDVGIRDVEPLIVNIIRLEPHTEAWIPMLDCLLQKAARLRLSGIEQRIDKLIFSDVIQLFIALGATREMRRGLEDLIGVCPELLADSTDYLDRLMRVCLDSDEDGTQLCLLVMDICDESWASFHRWCADNESKFLEVTWRLQLIPSYLSRADGHQLLAIIQKNASPVVTDLLLDRTKYQEHVHKLPRLEQFCKLFVQESWSPEECGEVCSKLLAQHKSGLSATQFAEIGRKFGEHQLHCKMCLRSAVWLLKSSETTEISADEVKKIVDELDWIVRDNTTKGSKLSKALLDDGLWSKFLKYALKIGLRTSNEDDEVCQLACPSLGLVINAWKLLATDVTDKVLTASQQVKSLG